MCSSSRTPSGRDQNMRLKKPRFLPWARLVRPPSGISRLESGSTRTGWNVRCRAARGPRPRLADLAAVRIQPSPRLPRRRWERDRAQPSARSDYAPLRFLRGSGSFLPPPRRIFPPPSERSHCRRSQEVEKQKNKPPSCLKSPPKPFPVFLPDTDRRVLTRTVKCQIVIHS